MKTFFHNGAAYPWTGDGTVFFRGYFIVEETLYRGGSALRYLREALSAKNRETVLRSLDGVFSIIWERKEETLLAVDRLRGLPLFYAQVNGELWAGDDAMALAQALPEAALSPEAEEDYFSTKLFVTGADTLLREIKQVPAASCCLWKKDEVICSPYFEMVHRDFQQDPSVLEAEMRKAYQTVGRRLIQALDGRTAVVPLSGGADSRMILSMLRKQGYEKVLCFTYGREGNIEAEISRKVAEQYGYPWIMVPYTRKSMRELGRSSFLRDYCRYSFAFSSTPHVQDLLAVKTLHENGKLPPDSVFVPGHSGDLIAGSHITSEFLRSSLTREELLDTVVRKFYNGALSPRLISRLKARFPASPPQNMEEMAAQSEWFNIQERQGKFIVNSVRVYEFSGCEWLIPLWDNALFDFWKHVPIELRYNRKLYFKVFGSQALQSGGTLPSTNDPSLAKSLGEMIRRIPGVRTLVRRGTRILRYFRSSNFLGCIFPFPEYLAACFRERPGFSVNDMICRRLLDNLRRNLKQNGRPSID